MKKLIRYILVLSACASLFACTEKEESGPERAGSIKAYPGIERIKIEFKAPDDAVSGKVYYNSGAVKAFDIDASSELQSVIVDGLPAGEVTLRVVSLTSDGRESLPKGVVSYAYPSNYYNGDPQNRRFISLQTISKYSVRITFGDAAPDEDGVIIEYTNTSGQKSSTTLSADMNVIEIDDIDTGYEYSYHSIYRPSDDCIDVFEARKTNLQEAALMQLDKHGWTVTASSSADGYSASLIADGNTLSCWKAAATGEQWLVIDFSSTKLFSGLIITQSQDLSSSTMAKHFSFETSDDALNWTPALDSKLKGNSYSQIFNFDEALRARYVRISLDNAYEALPFSLGEVDLFNELFSSSEEEPATMPGIVNGTPPFQGEGPDLATPLNQPGRMQHAVGWNTSSPTMITLDNTVGALCAWSAAAWGISGVTNGKVWQSFELLPGYYEVQFNLGHTTDVRCLDMFGIVATGQSLPDFDAVKTSAATLSYIDIPANQRTLQSLPFKVTETTYVSTGWVYTTYNFYAISGSIPWSDMYINGVSLEAR